jgi:glycosyltransferase involved in cell wall biosynthesis
MAIRTALLTNFVPPYRLPLLHALRDYVGDFEVFVSTQMEGDRPWIPDTGTLRVVQQKTKTFTRVRRHPSGFSLQMFIHFPYDTLAQLRRYKPEVVISSELGLRTLQAAIHRFLHPASRLIVWATLSEETEKGWGITRRMLRRFILGIADAVICNGNSGARYIGSLGFPADRTVIINQPIDVDMFAALPIDRKPETARRLMFSGRLIPAKAVVELQAAMVRWAKANPSRQIELVWVGDGELRAQLDRAELPSNFTQTFHGNKPYAALPSIYQDCGALILPSLMDEWGLVVNEAMASGLVVLGSVYSQAAIEMVRNGENGWLIDPLDSASIEAALDELYATPMDKLASMRVAARERALLITPHGAAARLYSVINMVRAGRNNIRSASCPPEIRKSADSCSTTTINSVR